MRAWLQRLFKDRRGNVLPTFALSIIPIMGFVGTAVDYSRANSVKSAMQAALDSTGLMLSKEVQTLTTEQLQQKASSYFNALFNRPEATGVTVSASLATPQAGSFVLTVSGTANVEMTFSKVMGQYNSLITASTEVKWGMKKLELALALDNTGSMSYSGKMTALKQAAHNLLTTLKNAAKKPEDVKVAIIPFGTKVKIGTAYKDEPWFDIDAIDCNGWLPGTGCNSTTWKQYWQGCVRDRTYPYDTQDTAPIPGTSATLFPVSDCNSIATAMPLTNDWTALNNRIDQMTPNGNTNVTIGLAWGWHALTQGAPWSEAAAPAPDLDKVLIILTDGTNTESWKNSNNSTVTSSSAIDIRTALACTNIKAANIRIYAIRVIDGNAQLLKDCATNPSMYFDVQDASQLNGVFTAIAQNLANLRLSK